MDREAVSVLSDGSTMTGTRALDNNLVDKLGGRNEAKLAFAEILEKNDSDIIFCEYESGFLPF